MSPSMSFFEGRERLYTGCHMRALVAHYSELPSSILTFWVNHVPYHFSFRSTSHRGFRGCFSNSQSWESCGPVLYNSHAGHTEVFQQWQKVRKVYYFLGCYVDISMFCGKGKNSYRYMYHSSKSKRTRDMVDWWVQFVWRLWLMGSCMHRLK